MNLKCSRLFTLFGFSIIFVKTIRVKEKLVEYHLVINASQLPTTLGCLHSFGTGFIIGAGVLAGQHCFVTSISLFPFWT